MFLLGVWASLLVNTLEGSLPRSRSSEKLVFVSTLMETIAIEAFPKGGGRFCFLQGGLGILTCHHTRGLTTQIHILRKGVLFTLCRSLAKEALPREKGRGFVSAGGLVILTCHHTRGLTTQIHILRKGLLCQLCCSLAK